MKKFFLASCFFSTVVFSNIACANTELIDLLSDTSEESASNAGATFQIHTPAATTPNYNLGIIVTPYTSRSCTGQPYDQVFSGMTGTPASCNTPARANKIYSVHSEKIYTLMDIAGLPDANIRNIRRMVIEDSETGAHITVVTTCTTTPTRSCILASGSLQTLNLQNNLSIPC